MSAILVTFLLFAHSFLFAQEQPSTTPIQIDDKGIQIPTATQSATPTQIAATPTPSTDPQEALFQQYKTDFLFNRDVYNRAYLEYVNKKQVHTRYGTLITQKEKIEATKTALIARNTMLRTFLMAQRVQLGKYKSADPTDTEKFEIDIQKWEAWLLEQNSVVNSLITEEDLKNNTVEFKPKHIQIQQLSYNASLQHQVNYYSLLLAQVQTYAITIKSSGLKPEGEQPYSEMQIKYDLVKQAFDAALATPKSASVNAFAFNNFYPEGKRELDKAKRYLTELRQDLATLLIRYSQTN